MATTGSHTEIADLENQKQASDAITEERADPPFQGIKNELEEMTALFKEIVSKWDSSEATKKNVEANLPSRQSSEANKKNDEANPLALCCQRTKKKPKALFEAKPLSHQYSEADKKKNGEANTLSRQSSEANRKNDEANSRWSENKEALLQVVVSRWDSSLALRSRWIKKKLEKLKALFEGRVLKWDDDLLEQVSAFEREVGNLGSGPYDNDVIKLNRIIVDIQRIRNLVTPEMALGQESRIRSMISEGIQKRAGHSEERSSFQTIKEELEKMIPLFDRGVSKCEDNIFSLVSALTGDVDNLVSGPYDINDGGKLNHIIGDIQRIRNLVTPGTAPDLEYRILMISETIQKKEQGIVMKSEVIPKKEPGDPQEGSSFQKIKKELKRMIAQFDGEVSQWEEYLLGQVSALERDVDNLVPGPDDNNGNIERKLNRIICDVKRIRKLVTPLRTINIDLVKEEDQPEKETSTKKASQEWQQLQVEYQFFENAKIKYFKSSFDNLGDYRLKLCLLFLSIFPENSVIKKRPLIYWWIGEGLITAKEVGLIKAERVKSFKTAENARIKTAEEVGEEIFVKLIAENLIIAKFDNEWNWSRVVNKCEVHPWIRQMLISSAKEAQLFVYDSTGTPSWNTSCRRACLDSKSFLDKSGQKDSKLLTVFNVNERYPSFNDDWLKKLKNVVALQLGQWQGSVEHHIEMENNILKDLGAQECLKYLSLRGISRITALPPSIVNLISLEILDLRACHNLESLPKKIGLLKKLTHLDVSECCLLESMPKGIEKLTALQVLKGFVVGDSNETSCRMDDLVKLKKLRKLSMRIGKAAVIQNKKFGQFKEIESLRCLTISWGKGREDMKLSSLSFPLYLEKLDLRGIPVKKAPQWLHPSQLKSLKKLYIRGGELDSLDSENGETGSWRVEILILKYLQHLKIEFLKLRKKFPHLRYLEKIECDDNDKDIVWDISKGWLWPKEEKQRHAAGESAASSSMA